jgi:hypothetical protein
VPLDTSRLLLDNPDHGKKGKKYNEPFSQQELHLKIPLSSRKLKFPTSKPGSRVSALHSSVNIYIYIYIYIYI